VQYDPPHNQSSFIVIPLVFSARYTLVFSIMPSFTPPLQILSNVFFSLQNATPSLADEADNRPGTAFSRFLLAIYC
jgi:hypothetical protein